MSGEYMMEAGMRMETRLHVSMSSSQGRRTSSGFWRRMFVWRPSPFLLSCIYTNLQVLCVSPTAPASLPAPAESAT
jgi:hypothetical protein